MKLFLLAFFVAAALAAPTPDDDPENVEFIVNGVPEGQALELGNILGIKVKEHVNGALASATNPLHAYTAVGIAEAAAEAAAADAIASPAPIENDVVIPEPVALPAPALPEVTVPEESQVIPEPVILPAPALPEVVVEPVVPEPVALPAPAVPEVVPEPVVLPAPVAPEVVIPEVVEELPVAEPQVPNGEVFNNGVVQVHVNAPQEVSMLSTLQSWFSMVINYFNGDVQSSHQIV